MPSSIPAWRPQRGADGARGLLEGLHRTRGRRGRDEYGHGTHVAGIIAGSGDGRRRRTPGMAPGAASSTCACSAPTARATTSDVIEAIDWAIGTRPQYNIRVINLSLGHPVTEPYADDPLCQAVERAVAAGIVVVAAAGNFGKTRRTARPIVGGHHRRRATRRTRSRWARSNTQGTVARADDMLATYSSRGPTRDRPGAEAGPGRRRGTQIVAAEAPGSYLVRTYPERVVAGRGARNYLELSGTSMSAAVVAGAAALVLEARPRITPAQLKVALQLTASMVPARG